MKRKDIIKVLILLVIGIILPRIMLFYLVCGILDFKRSNRFETENWRRYFFGNGLLTWILSPINLLLDCICLKNKHIYELQDLQDACQDEIEYVINVAKNNPQIIEELNQQMQNKSRGMIFFKWYGKNCKTNLVIPEYQKNFLFIRTIGISIFNKNQVTSTHYGPLRITLRVLYNLFTSKNDNVYIEVGNKTHYWHDNPLFIFDDTLVHKSVNNSDELRYCMFIDILRPSSNLSVLNILLKFVRVLTLSYNMVFYKNWKRLS